jgi:hypothetical protein
MFLRRACRMGKVSIWARQRHTGLGFKAPGTSFTSSCAHTRHLRAHTYIPRPHTARLTRVDRSIARHIATHPSCNITNACVGHAINQADPPLSLRPRLPHHAHAPMATRGGAAVQHPGLHGSIAAIATCAASPSSTADATRLGLPCALAAVSFGAACGVAGRASSMRAATRVASIFAAAGPSMMPAIYGRWQLSHSTAAAAHALQPPPPPQQPPPQP